MKDEAKMCGDFKWFSRKKNHRWFGLIIFIQWPLWCVTYPMNCSGFFGIHMDSFGKLQGWSNTIPCIFRGKWTPPCKTGITQEDMEFDLFGWAAGAEKRHGQGNKNGELAAKMGGVSGFILQDGFTWLRSFQQSNQQDVCFKWSQ